MGCTQLHPKHTEKSFSTAGELDFTMPRKRQIHTFTFKPELSNSCFQTSLSQQGGFSTVVKTFEPKWTYQQSAALTSLTSSCLWKTSREKTDVFSRQTCLTKSSKSHSKPSMEMGTAIKTAAAPPVCVMPTFYFNASALWSEIVSSM